MERIPASHVRVFGMFAAAFVLCGCAYAYSLMGQMLPTVASLVVSIGLGLGVVRAALAKR